MLIEEKENSGKNESIYSVDIIIAVIVVIVVIGMKYLNYNKYIRIRNSNRS